jgi:2-polyprenyl-6-methoxyphenol hydroxylase-like FAD-dependent oxidoreductase
MIGLRVPMDKSNVPSPGGSTSTSATRILVVGGGIGGLTLAQALRARGLEPLVLEPASELRELGAGLTLWSNALRALARIGLDRRDRRARLAACAGPREGSGAARAGEEPSSQGDQSWASLDLRPYFLSL